MGIKYVAQKYDADCGIACLAMALGLAYSRVEIDFAPFTKTDGMNPDATRNYIASQGYSVVSKTAAFYSKVKENNSRMLKPFAPVHLVRVKIFANSKMNHLVVMDSKGRVFDPSEESVKSLAEYYEIIEVIGCWKD